MWCVCVCVCVGGGGMYDKALLKFWQVIDLLLIFIFMVGNKVLWYCTFTYRIYSNKCPRGAAILGVLNPFWMCFSHKKNERGHLTLLESRDGH